MIRKILCLGFMALLLIGCVSLHRDEPVDIYQRTQAYEKFSYDHVWSAALASVGEVDFRVRSANKEIGLIQAVAKLNPDPASIPPRMNIVIREENNRIDVNFHIELPGQRDDAGKRRTLAKRFFKSLKRNLK